jgi:hypothetical protein
MLDKNNTGILRYCLQNTMISVNESVQHGKYQATDLLLNKIFNSLLLELYFGTCAEKKKYIYSSAQAPNYEEVCEVKSIHFQDLAKHHIQCLLLRRRLGIPRNTVDNSRVRRNVSEVLVIQSRHHNSMRQCKKAQL